MTREERKEMIRERHIEFEAKMEEMQERRSAIHSEWFGMLSEYGFSFRDLFTAYVLASKELDTAEVNEYSTRGSEDSAHDYAYGRLCDARDLYLALDNLISCVCSRLDGSDGWLSNE